MNITYGDVTVESIPQGRHSVIRFLWAKQLSTNAVQSSSIQYGVTSILLERQYMFGAKNLLSRESVVEQKRLGRRVVLMSDDRCNDHGSSFSRIDLIDGINA